MIWWNSWRNMKWISVTDETHWECCINTNIDVKLIHNIKWKAMALWNSWLILYEEGQVNFMKKYETDNSDEVKSMTNIIWTPLATWKLTTNILRLGMTTWNWQIIFWGSQERRNVNKLDFVTAGVLPLHIVFMEVKIEFQQRQMKWQNLITLTGRVAKRQGQTGLMFSLRAELCGRHKKKICP